MKKILSCLLICGLLNACSWQRIPPSPEYVLEETIPLKVGIILADSPASMYYGPAVIKEWQSRNLFRSIDYPYRKGDRVDAVMRLTITGGWNTNQVGNFATGFVTGLTLGIAGAAVGTTMTGTHDVAATINKSSNEIGRYTIQAISTVEWGMTASTNEVSKKGDDLQKTTIAVKLANKIQEDRQNLLSNFKKHLKDQ